jgi:rhomboid protease GluP
VHDGPWPAGANGAVERGVGGVEVFHSAAPGPCGERQLVLESLGIPSWVAAAPADYRLLVPAADAPRAREELRRWTLENPPPVAIVPPQLHRGATAAAIVWAAALFVQATCATNGVFGRDWFAAGALEGVAFRAGDWWRPLTALGLHADLAHLAANAGFGALLGGLAARLRGVGVAWLSILVAAVLANVANGFAMPPARVSIGASTAVFAALGWLAVQHWPLPTRRARGGARASSVGAAFVLLALLGTGDARTDVLAHALGFGCGALTGVATRSWRPGTRGQWVAAGVALALPVLGWMVAFGR